MSSSSPSKVESIQDKRKFFKYYNQRSQIDVFDQEDVFGPKATILKSSEEQVDYMKVEDPSCDHHLLWKSPPKRILLMKKFRDPEVTASFKIMARWLVEELKLTIICEPAILEDALIQEEKFEPIASTFVTWTDSTRDEVLGTSDLIICLGGDGTLLYTSSLFQESIPPVLSFNMGSLGFLTPFPIDEYKTHIKRTFDAKVSITLRHRLLCEIRTQHKISLPSLSSDDFCHVDPFRDSPISPPPSTIHRPTFPTKMTSHIEDVKTKLVVMNEVVIDRGPSPYLTNLELFCNGRPMTTVQGDGVIIATPTGSTAYSLAAGASMVHPSVPCMVVSPICPHSLSFRSIVVPAGVQISIRVAPDSRNTAWVAFDGRNRQEILQGDCVAVTTSPNPVPSINNTGHVTDWFDSLAECLNWNVRKQQKKLKI